MAASYYDLQGKDELVRVAKELAGVRYEKAVEEAIDLFGDAGASRRHHHSAKGGLLYHSVHVGLKARALAEKDGAPITAIRRAARGGLFHDIGKAFGATEGHEQRGTEWMHQHDIEGDTRDGYVVEADVADVLEWAASFSQRFRRVLDERSSDLVYDVWIGDDRILCVPVEAYIDAVFEDAVRNPPKGRGGAVRAAEFAAVYGGSPTTRRDFLTTVIEAALEDLFPRQTRWWAIPRLLTYPSVFPYDHRSYVLLPSGAKPDWRPKTRSVLYGGLVYFKRRWGGKGSKIEPIRAVLAEDALVSGRDDAEEVEEAEACYA